MSIGTRLRRERERLGLTQQQLADLGSFNLRTLQGWERGKLPRDYGTLLDLARFLAIPPAELLREAAGAHAPAPKGRPAGPGGKLPRKSRKG